MASISKVSSDEVQALTGLNNPQWKRFFRITLAEAKELVKLYPTSWVGLPYMEQEALWERVNEALRNENIPAVDENIISWRMIRAIDYAKAIRPTASASASVTVPRSLPYDPVRDLAQG
ncbi:hypothetical protein BU24DRAFT_462999 [Aaosphaeria arxii CBS 175.79]|uniref:Uncharacterized protein n=1 Tax=Aaosphaeria arxii CBS 175.79 TaxID=1450172 RepID=A0A6A5XN68_9PLEO|nr:uncharacterized protein BU24DRAFT_462999 [Aaosphaeria arxii CBS 175.79]KAF2014190.1 hypothetical protein BU24DRAFT_462999 [Aaosphaeria arxii CBS 175.79]